MPVSTQSKWRPSTTIALSIALSAIGGLLYISHLAEWRVALAGVLVLLGLIGFLAAFIAAVVNGQDRR